MRWPLSMLLATNIHILNRALRIVEVPSPCRRGERGEVYQQNKFAKDTLALSSATEKL